MSSNRGGRGRGQGRRNSGSESSSSAFDNISSAFTQALVDFPPFFEQPGQIGGYSQNIDPEQYQNAGYNPGFQVAFPETQLVPFPTAETGPLYQDPSHYPLGLINSGGYNQNTDPEHFQNAGYNPGPLYQDPSQYPLGLNSGSESSSAFDNIPSAFTQALVDFPQFSQQPGGYNQNTDPEHYQNSGHNPGFQVAFPETQLVPFPTAETGPLYQDPDQYTLGQNSGQYAFNPLQNESYEVYQNAEYYQYAGQNPGQYANPNYHPTQDASGANLWGNQNANPEYYQNVDQNLGSLDQYANQDLLDQNSGLGSSSWHDVSELGGSGSMVQAQQPQQPQDSSEVPFNATEAIGQLIQSDFPLHEDNEIQNAVDILTNQHPKLRDIMHGQSIPVIDIEGLSIFQRLLKCLLYQLASTITRYTIYDEVVQFCQRRGDNVNPQSVIAIPESFWKRVEVKGSNKKVITEFAMEYDEGHSFSDQLCMRLRSEQLLKNLVQLKGVGYKIGFFMILFGLRRLDFVPAMDSDFRKAWKAYHGRNKTPVEDISKDLTWAPYSGVAAYIVWSFGKGAP